MSQQLSLDFERDPQRFDRYAWTDRTGALVVGILAAWAWQPTPSLTVRVEQREGQAVAPYEERYGRERWPSFVAHGWTRAEYEAAKRGAA